MSIHGPRRVSGRALATYAWLVLAFMVLVVLWGAVVRATGSGAGCGNHWPLCNGDFVPHHPRLATVIEFTHRSMSGILTALVAILIGWVFWQTSPGDRSRSASVWVAILLITEALLGAVLVKGGYVESNASNARVTMQCIHFTNTMLLLGALTLTAWSLTTRDIPSEGPRRKLWAVAVILALMVGATGSVAALADTLFPSPSLRAGIASDLSASAPLIVRMRSFHPLLSMLLVGLVLVLCLRDRTRASSIVLWLLCFQTVCGVADVLLLAPTWMQVLHLLGADLFWIGLVVLASKAFVKQQVVAT